MDTGYSALPGLESTVRCSEREAALSLLSIVIPQMTHRVQLGLVVKHIMYGTFLLFLPLADSLLTEL